MTLALGCICVDTSSLTSDFRGEGDCDVLGEDTQLQHQMVTRGQAGGKRGKNSDVRRGPSAVSASQFRSDIVPFVNYPPTGIAVVHSSV